MTAINPRLDLVGVFSNALKRPAEANIADLVRSALTVGGPLRIGTNYDGRVIIDATGLVLRDALRKLTDVDLSAAPLGDHYTLAYNSTRQKWNAVNPAAFFSLAEFATLADVDITVGPDIDGFAVVWNNDIERWVAVPLLNVPAGGTTGQVLIKASDDDGDAVWTTQPYDIGFWIAGAPTANEKVFGLVVIRAFSWLADIAGSSAKAGAAATASTTFTIKKNGSSIGTIVFGAAAATATFTTSGGDPVSFAVGDIVTIEAPATPDATLADIAFTLAGVR